MKDTINTALIMATEITSKASDLPFSDKLPYITFFIYMFLNFGKVLAKIKELWKKYL